MTRSVAVLFALAAALATAAPASAQTLGHGADTDIPWLRLTAALLLCLGLAYGGALALRKRLGVGGAPSVPALEKLMQGWLSASPDRSPPRLTEIETRRLSPQVTVSVFRCDGRSFMVTATAQGQLVLVSLDDAPSDGT